jgi:hypothetical protein
MKKIIISIVIAFVAMVVMNKAAEQVVESGAKIEYSKETQD